MKQLSSQIVGIALVALGIILFLGLVSYTPYDIPSLSAPYHKIPHNLIGIFGSYLGFFLFFLLGVAAYFLPFFFFFRGLSRLGVIRFEGIAHKKVISLISFLFLLFFLPPLVGIFYAGTEVLYNRAGLIGYYLSRFFRMYLGFWGAFISLSIIAVVNALILFGYFFVDICALLARVTGFLKERIGQYRQARLARHEQAQKVSRAKKPLVRERTVPVNEKTPPIKIYTPKITPPQSSGPQRQEPPPGFPEPADIRQSKLTAEQAKKKMEDLEQEAKKTYDPRTYVLPHLGILKPPPATNVAGLKEDIKSNIRNLEDTLADFGVQAKVVSVQKGPVVTMYELEPHAGVKIQKITVLSDDIALSMKTASVRIVAPIPGRGTVGVEVPNTKKHLVYLREVLEEKAFAQSLSPLSLAIGKDVKGDPVVADLKDMPHLLIAGATGSGKTVCVNAMIISILFKARPDQVKFIMVDPKMVELAPFAGIPHLIHPIISEAKKVFGALNWAVEEMEARYKLLAGEGARNIDAYNRKQFRLPYIVIVIDELADLMIIARDSIETSIQRLAQLSRAVGIHLILATQRPSVDVITGVIKANFPARISFKVSSKVDSRTVLDLMGAEKLLGKGDLLFLKPGAPRPIRAQCSLIEDDDIERLTDFVRNQGAPVYEEKIANPEKSARGLIEEDELFPEAVKIVLMTQQASASLLQRRMRVGYTRAARLLDLMEQAGIVGPFCGSKAREIIVDPQVYLAEQGLV
ncbi:MAG: DNA translocase FtsK 4TM domain-containing protein [Candidatus Omnitrophica bacterium]|nr:DNA translocase FtsK 4TM domain-containing protein [Candidatus Omnitrophota bacterium]